MAESERSVVPFPYITRNDPLGRATRQRIHRTADPKFFGFDSVNLTRKYNGDIATGAQTLYTCPSAKRAISMPGLYVIHNPTAGAIAFDFHHVPSGGSVQNSNRMGTFTLASDATTTIITSTLWHVVMSGDALVINPGTQGLNAWGIFHEERSEIAAYIGGAVNDIAAATDTTILTCPALHTLVLANIVTHNFNAGASAQRANLRESGVAAGDSNELMAASVAAGAETSYDRFLMASIVQGGVLSVYSDVTDVNFWANAILV